MQKNKKNTPKGFKFNFYWIYGIIAILFFGLQILGSSSNTKQISWNEFNRNMLQAKEVEKIVVVNKEIAQIFIKEDALDKEKHSDVKLYQLFKIQLH